MAARVSDRGRTVTVSLSVKLCDSMLESEEAIQRALNEAGTKLTGEALEHFDTDGSALEFGGKRWSTKGRQPKRYQSSYGGGRGEAACLSACRQREDVLPAGARWTDRDHLDAAPGAAGVLEDGADACPGGVSRSVGEPRADGGALVRAAPERGVGVAAVVQATEESWEYAPPELAAPIATVAVGLDGTTLLLLCEEGWREAMVGTVSLSPSASHASSTSR